MLAKENGVDKYRISIYLFDGVNEFDMELTGDLEEKIRNYPEFRKTLGTVLGKPFSRPPGGDVITSEDINVSAQKNTGSAPEEDGDGSGNNDGTGGGDDEGNDGSLPTGPDPTYEVLGTVYIETHGSSRYRLEYPQISGLGDEAIRSSINSIIKEEALKVLTYCMEDPADKCQYRLSYHKEITRSFKHRIPGTGKLLAYSSHTTCTSLRISIPGQETRSVKDIVEISDKFTGSSWTAGHGSWRSAGRGAGQLDNQTLKELLPKRIRWTTSLHRETVCIQLFHHEPPGHFDNFREIRDPSDSGQATAIRRK